MIESVLPIRFTKLCAATTLNTTVEKKQQSLLLVASANYEEALPSISHGSAQI